MAKVKIISSPKAFVTPAPALHEFLSQTPFILYQCLTHLSSGKSSCRALSEVSGQTSRIVSPVPIAATHSKPAAPGVSCLYSLQLPLMPLKGAAGVTVGAKLQSNREDK